MDLVGWIGTSSAVVIDPQKVEDAPDWPVQGEIRGQVQAKISRRINIQSRQIRPTICQSCQAVIDTRAFVAIFGHVPGNREQVGKTDLSRVSATVVEEF